MLIKCMIECKTAKKNSITPASLWKNTWLSMGMISLRRWRRQMVTRGRHINSTNKAIRKLMAQPEQNNQLKHNLLKS